MNPRRLLVSASVASLLLSLEAGHAQTSPDAPRTREGATAQLPEAARDLLGAIDVPLSPERLAAAGVDAEVATSVVADPRASRYLRARSLAALAQLGGDRARAVLYGALGDEDQEIRIQASIMVARRLGPERPDEVRRRLHDRLAAATEAERAVIAAELATLEGRLAAPPQP